MEELPAQIHGIKSFINVQTVVKQTKPPQVAVYTALVYRVISVTQQPRLVHGQNSETELELNLNLNF